MTQETMTQIVTTRLPREIVLELDEVSRSEYVDRASLLRKMIIEHLREYILSQAAVGYRKGLLSLEEAAVKAKVSLWQMMDYLAANNITALGESMSELEESLARTRRLFSAK